MDLKFLMAAEAAVVSQATNQLSIFNIIEEIRAPGFPLAVSPLVVVFMLRRVKREAEEKNLTVRFDLNKDLRLLDAVFRVNFQGKLYTRGMANLQGLVIPTPGILIVRLLDGNQELGLWRVRITEVGSASLKTILLPPQGDSATGRKVARKKTMRKVSAKAKKKK